MSDKTELNPEQALLGLDALEKWVKAEKDKIKHKVSDQMLADYKANGIEKRAVKHPVTGERIASWTVPVPKSGPKVTDPDALLDYLAKRRPELTETVLMRDAHKVIASEYPKDDDGNLFDESTGEMVPGVKIDVGTPTYIRASYEGGKARQQQIVREALEGRFPLELEAGVSDA